jgi:cytochrome P450
MVMGTSAHWRVRPHEYMRELVRTYGSAVRYHYAFGQYAYLLTHPDHYRRILHQNQRNYDKIHPMYDSLRIALGDGLVTANGDVWLRHRRAMQPSFHRSLLADIGRVVATRTQAMLERWETQRRAAAPRASAHAELVVNADDEMSALTLAIVGDALFGVDLSSRAETVASAFSMFSREMVSVATRPVAWLTIRYPVLPSVRRLHRSAATLRAVADAVIDERLSKLRMGIPATDLLGVLLEGNGPTEPFLRDEVRDEVSTLMLAGHETSATALTWALHLVGEHPSVERHLVEELSEVLGGRLPTAADLEALAYTRAVALEAMRLYPPIWAMDRRAVADDVVRDVEIPAGAFISLSPYVTHRMPEFWGEPDRFLPERFMPNARPIERLAFMPFSAGARGCIGEHFAMLEIVLVLATILQQYHLRTTPDCSIVANPLITLRPQAPVRMWARRRA